MSEHGRFPPVLVGECTLDGQPRRSGEAAHSATHTSRQRDFSDGSRCERPHLSIVPSAPSSEPDLEESSSSSSGSSGAPAARAAVGVVDPSQLPYLLTADEVAALLRTTRKAVYARAERGLLPGIIYDGRRVLVRRDVLLRSLSERRAVSPGGTRR